MHILLRPNPVEVMFAIVGFVSFELDDFLIVIARFAPTWTRAEIIASQNIAAPANFIYVYEHTYTVAPQCYVYCKKSVFSNFHLSLQYLHR